jgi:cytochrome c oxidase cbb3-type subunit 3/ubiquinol-cytochrome c reductase cytochrome c subunit
LSLFLAAGCELPGQPRPADRPVPADQIKDFGALYSTRCSGCHGADGKLGPAPPLNDPLFLAIVPDADLLRVITAGRAVTAGQRSPMPAFAEGRGGPLTDAQVKVLAEGIKTRWGPPASPAGTPPPYLASAGTGGGNKGAGAGVFARACAGCHGMDGEGVESDGRIRRKIHDPAFLALISDQELRRYVITGRPDLGMPPYDLRAVEDGDGKAGRPPDYRPLTSADINDLVALLASWRQGGTATGK